MGSDFAIVAQGDRWVIGSLMGLPFLGLYVVATLGAYVPLSGLYRIIGAIQFAGLYHSDPHTAKYNARLKLFCRATPAIGAAYALSVITFYGFVLPIIFGHRYVISEGAVFLLAMIAFLRIIRANPQTSLLLYTQNTRTLALANQAPIIGLVTTAGLAVVHPMLEFILVGGLVGEIASVTAFGYATRKLLGLAFYDHVLYGLAMLTIVVSAGVLTLTIESPHALAFRMVIGGGSMLMVVVYAVLSLPNLYRIAYPTH